MVLVVAHLYYQVVAHLYYEVVKCHLSPKDYKIFLPLNCD